MDCDGGTDNEAWRILEHNNKNGLSSQESVSSRRLVETLCSTWEAIVGGRSGVGRITRFDPDGYETTIAGEVKDFDPVARLGRKDARRTDRYTHFAVAAALEALEQAGLKIDEANADRVGVLIGSGMGGAETLDAGMETVLTRAPDASVHFSCRCSSATWRLERSRLSQARADRTLLLSRHAPARHTQLVRQRR